MKIFVVKDVKSQLFLQPFFNRSVAEAIRGWEVVANEGESMISKFPHDFRLLELGDFSENGGRFDLHSDPIDLGSAADVKRKSVTDMFGEKKVV